jgi:type IV secretory pathway VirJ component
MFGLLSKNAWLSVLIFFSGIGNVAAGQSVDFPLKLGVNDTSKYMVFHITGDGGWMGFDIKLTKEFQAYHMPYVVLNSRKYFWKSKTPDGLAKDMIPVMYEYLKKWNKNEILLTGFSFGAEIIPFLYNRLPDDLKDKVKMITMITPAGTSDFTIHLTDMMGIEHQYKYDVVKEVGKIKNIKILAIFGKKEHSTFPADYKQKNVSIAFIKGTHHFTDDKTVMGILINELHESPDPD